jgi:hypothetical protein
MDHRILELEMAHRFFGFGSWDASYWFIGPEQGKGPKEAADNTARVDAWVRLGKQDLVDCKTFHYEIGEESWHRESPKPRLQPTWRPLMLILRTILDESTERDALRTYQRDRWGKVTVCETCIIELCGLAARGLATAMDRERFREERVEIIRQKLCEHRPKVVVMYGKNEKKRWETIAGGALEVDQPYRVGSTILVFTTHPNTHGRRNSDWEQLGERLRQYNPL